jgi:hypothetical protein
MSDAAPILVSPTTVVAAPVLTARLRISRISRATLVLVSFLLAACGDSPMAPTQSIDRVAAARVVPSVIDARVRVATGIQNEAIRMRATHDLSELEIALANGDGQKARFHVRVLSDVLSDYRAQQTANPDGADVTAIMLMLHAVSQVVDAKFVLPTAL